MSVRVSPAAGAAQPGPPACLMHVHQPSRKVREWRRRSVRAIIMQSAAGSAARLVLGEHPLAENVRQLRLSLRRWRASSARTCTTGCPARRAFSAWPGSRHVHRPGAARPCRGVAGPATSPLGPLAQAGGLPQQCGIAGARQQDRSGTGRRAMSITRTLYSQGRKPAGALGWISAWTMPVRTSPSAFVFRP